MQIQNKKCVALLDSGSARTICSENFFQKLNVSLEPLQDGESKRMFAANGSAISVIGKASLNVKINGLIIPFEFLVLKQITQNVILGSDFFWLSQANISYEITKLLFMMD